MRDGSSSANFSRPSAYSGAGGNRLKMRSSDFMSRSSHILTRLEASCLAGGYGRSGTTRSIGERLSRNIPLGNSEVDPLIRTLVA